MDSLTKDSILQTAVLIRQTEYRLLDLFSQGKLYGTVHTCIGQELSGAVLAQFLTEDDYKFSNHRCHGHKEIKVCHRNLCVQAV
jgi:2-oxoisovalerate dehydrogenase E1 component